MSFAPRIGLVVPVLNDAPALGRLLDRVRQAGPPADLRVVDGGSTDDSVMMAQRRGVAVISAGGGRGAQMNAGAAAAIAAGCNVLWFLHADAIPPDRACERIAEAVARGYGAGAFRRRFESNSWFLGLTCWLADWRCRWFGWFLGDQGIFVTTDVFSRVHGFKAWDWFEDLDFSRRVRRATRTILLPDLLRTSARRFEGLGAWRQTWRDFRAVVRYLRTGKPPARDANTAALGVTVAVSSREGASSP